ncbi:MAG TPA: hypothetical protein VJ124_13055 [Pyrinomonadaceae bacterium]|nr:hypothetical protein [Pyrinomonadaceae bacterium]
MNKFLRISVLVVLALLVAFANEEASAQTDAQFLNDLATDTRKTLPLTIGDVEFTDASTYCPAGCQHYYATNVLAITGWTPRLANQNVSMGQLEQSVKPQMLKDYCTSPAKQRNIGAAVYIYDMYKAYIGVFSITSSDCAAVSVRPNVTPNTSGTSVEDQYWDAVKNSSRVGDFQAYLNQYPYGQYASLARLRINQLSGSVSSVSAPTTVWSGSSSSTSPSASSTVEQQYWDAVKSSSRSEDFQSYLRDYPNGQFVPIARLKISQLGGNQPTNAPNLTAEEQYWNNISSSQRSQDFQGYIYNYPNGTYASLARLRISQLGGNTTQGSPVVSAVEEQYWNNVKYSQRAQDFQDYLNTYPNGQYALIARLRINQLTATGPGNTFANPPRQQTAAEILASAQYGSIREILPLRRVFVVASDLDSRDTILKELQKLPKLMVVGRKEDAELFVLFALTDQGTGANIASNTNPVDQTYLGEMLVFSTRAGTNGETIPRILWRTKKTQVFSSGITFNRHPAVNAAREFVKELEKINY